MRMTLIVCADSAAQNTKKTTTFDAFAWPALALSQILVLA